MGSLSVSNWDIEAAAHLLRRASFGGTPEEAERFEASGLEGAVEELLSEAGGRLLPAPRTDSSEHQRRRALRRGINDADPRAEQERRSFERAARETLADLRTWWLERMRAETRGAREKLTLFWHGHFATSQTKVRFLHAMLVQNEAFRRLGMGPFRELCSAMVKDPAMLIWLDGRQSRAKAPNENFAREILELFTLGEGHYTEEDVREAARCFTGWTVRMNIGEAAFVARRHDGGRKVLFGKSGDFGPDEAVDIICSRPRCAEFLAAKLWEFYAYPEPDAALVRSLAAHYRANDLRTGDLLRIIFTHPEFYSARARGSQIKSPVQWLVQAARETGRQLLPPGVALPLAAELGQNLFMPPSVKGWDGGTSWINSATLIRRSNSARLLAVAAPPMPDPEAVSMDAAAWAKVAPREARVDAGSLSRRLEKVFLAAPAAPPTRERLKQVLAGADFPCSDEMVREASIVLLGSPEYNLC